MTTHHPKETSRASRRRDAMLALVPEDGITVAGVAKAMGILHASAEARLRLYAKAGHLFMARVNRAPKTPVEGWYFRDAAKRDAVQAACCKKVAPKPALPKWMQARSVALPVEATNPNGVQPTVCSNTLRDRFTPDEVPPLFSSLRPGQYIAPAPAWLAGISA